MAWVVDQLIMFQPKFDSNKIKTTTQNQSNLPLRFSRSIKYLLGQNKYHTLHMAWVVKYLKRFQVEFNTHRTKTKHNGIVKTNLTSQQGFQYQLSTYKSKINKKLHVAWVVNIGFKFNLTPI